MKRQCLPRMDQWEPLIDGCKKNDRASQERLYKSLYPALYHLCKKFFADDHDILTAVNTGMLKVFSSLDAYDPHRGNFFNWVYTIVRNSALTILKSRKNEQVFQPLDDLRPEEELSESFPRAKGEELFDYLGLLPPATRAICSLFYLEGFSIKEIAANLNLKEGTVKWHLNESRIRLTKLFTKNNP